MVGRKTCRGEPYWNSRLLASVHLEPLPDKIRLRRIRVRRPRDREMLGRRGGNKGFQDCSQHVGGTPAYRSGSRYIPSARGFFGKQGAFRARRDKARTRRRSLRRGGATPARRARGVQWGEKPTCARYIDVGHAGGLTKTFAMRSLGAFQLVGKSRASRRRSGQGGKSAGMGYHPRPFSAASRSASVRAGHWKLPPSFPTFAWRGSQPHMEIVE
jgi:hypothetical protein